VICVAAADDADQIAASMLAQLLQQRGCAAWDLRFEGTAGGIERDLKNIADYRPDALCISALPPFALLHARMLAKRLRERFPDLKMVVGLWNLPADKQALDRVSKAFADPVATTLRGAIEEIGGGPVDSEPRAEPIAEARRSTALELR
jgi:methanogenic corrinoid protein MtbC1